MTVLTKESRAAEGPVGSDQRAAESGSLVGLRESDPVWAVELDTSEQEHAKSVLEQDLLEPMRSVGIKAATPDFFNAAEVVEGALPQRARSSLAALRRGRIPAVLLKGLPSDDDPGATPTESGEGSDRAERGHAWISMVVRKLGDEFGYAMEKKGSLVHDIFPTREGAETQSNAAFKVDLSLHTENAFHPIRPDWVTLYCVRAPEDPPATRLVILDEVLVQLTDDEIEILREPRFKLRVVDSHRAEGEADIAMPVAPISGSPRRPVVRWHETLEATDEVAARTAETFTRAAHRATRRLKLGEGDMLIFANEFCLHGRDRFNATLDGTDRWLLRGYALRDLTRTTAYVAPVNPRVTRIDLTSSIRH